MRLLKLVLLYFTATMPLMAGPAKASVEIRVIVKSSSSARQIESMIRLNIIYEDLTSEQRQVRAEVENNVTLASCTGNVVLRAAPTMFGTHMPGQAFCGVTEPGRQSSIVTITLHPLRFANMDAAARPSGVMITAPNIARLPPPNTKAERSALLRQARLSATDAADVLPAMYQAGDLAGIAQAANELSWAAHLAGNRRDQAFYEGLTLETGFAALLELAQQNDNILTATATPIEELLMFTPDGARVVMTSAGQEVLVEFQDGIGMTTTGRMDFGTLNALAEHIDDWPS